MRNVFFVITICLVSFKGIAQHETNPTESKETQKHHSMKGASRLTLGLGHTHIAEGVEGGEKKWLVAPSWSFNFDYWLSNKWGLGLQTDMILETFKIEDHENEVIERKSPFTIVPVALFKPGKHLTLIGGVGAEMDGENTFILTRLGLEYGWHVPGNWEIGASLVWDGKWNYYNSWGLAFTISKIWPKKH